MFFARSKKDLLALPALALFFAALPVLVQASSKADAQNHRKPVGDKREESLEKVKTQVLALLQDENGCSAWFREAESDPAGVFRSLQFKIEEDKKPYVLRMSDTHGDRYKQPWAAQTWQSAGRNSKVLLNSEGPFFNPSSPVVELTTGGRLTQYLGFRALSVGPFKGNTPEAQMTTLLHELGHITDRVPVDGDSWDGKSSRNTEEVLRHCKSEIIEFAKRNAGERD